MQREEEQAAKAAKEHSTQGGRLGSILTGSSKKMLDESSVKDGETSNAKPRKSSMGSGEEALEARTTHFAERHASGPGEEPKCSVSMIRGSIAERKPAMERISLPTVLALWASGNSTAFLRANEAGSVGCVGDLGLRAIACHMTFFCHNWRKKDLEPRGEAIQGGSRSCFRNIRCHQA